MPQQSTRALVLGAGLAGTLAASVLARHVDRVTVVERDRFEPGAAHRKGVPHARHAHVLLAAGARALEELLPGVTRDLTAAGARHLGLPNQLLTHTQAGWLPRLAEMQFLIGCSRALLDRTVRERVLADDRVELVEAADVVGLSGDRARVTGARVRDRGTGGERELTADLVVDATGRGSRADRWLADLGLPPVREDLVDSGMVYATRVYRAPAGAEGFPGVNIQGDPTTDRVARGGVLLPIEGGRWVVSLGGTRGGEPADLAPEGFTAYARGLRHPAIADLISAAEPLTRPYGFHATVNRHRRYERMTPWPVNFAVMGDAACTFNPVYGHGMTVLARQALALRDHLERHGPDHADRLQRALAAETADAWAMAVGQDQRYPATTGPRRGRAARLLDRYLDRMVVTATGRPSVTKAQIDTYTLSAPLSRLLHPATVLGVLRGPAHPPPADVPFTPAELAVLARGDRSS
ncbi:FAD-dependent oxidoreductase [Saccharothrix syringae]|uniref:FAD-dependent oxidoreductase n=1 Tax=Saccharothrix syringae TaxID=103733 RepID=A0A5Q0H2F8_SACSY|nr:FAD-dependent oxidoreductase [Saccharothrix syringae]QFZ20319.1 FAD-dependent oxidoreductase [Saccharothrix syringae]